MSITAQGCAAGATPVIPRNPTHAHPVRFDRGLYRERHSVECFINKIKHFRRLATRYDKTGRAFLAAIILAALMTWLR